LKENIIGLIACILSDVIIVASVIVADDVVSAAAVDNSGLTANDECKAINQSINQ